MRPVLQLTLVVALAAVTLSPLVSSAARAQDEHGGEEEVEEEVWVASCAEVVGVCVHAAERRSLAPVDTPDRTTPPTVVCVWYPSGSDPGGWDDPEGSVPVSVLRLGGLYVIDCHRTADGVRVVGYPHHWQHDGETIPGEAMAGWEVADYAVGLLGLEVPVAAVAPPSMQIVGVETWFAVTSKLRGYPERSAQAGSVWATVHAYFADVTWDFGAYGRLRCTIDAGLTWSPGVPASGQASACTRVFDTVSGPGGLDATATVRWIVLWRSSEHSGWRRHKDYTRTTVLPLDVREIQAVIR